jgi:uroporphyrinogen decarboxylase
MQSSFEVIDSLLRGKKADRIGIMDNPWPDTLTEWVKQGYPVDADGKPVEPSDHFDFDLVSCGGWFDWHPKIGYEELIEESDEWTVKRNGSGGALKYWKNKSGTPEHIDFIMTSREIWENEYKPLIAGTALQRIEPKVEETIKMLAEQKKKAKWRLFGHQFIWESMRASLGDVCLYESMALDPDWILDYGRVYTDLFKECFRLLIEKAGKPDGVWMYEDLGYKNALFCSPATYSKLIFPFFVEMVEFFHSYDLPVVLHTCGFVEPAIDMIIEAGFDGLNPMEVKAGNDPLRIADKYGDKIAFIGGLSAMTLETGDRELIRKEVSGLVEGMKHCGARFVYASDHSISPMVKYDDFKYAIEVYREHMMY